jgi:hypothetical protein
MRVYVGQTRSRALIPRLTEMGFGEIVQRHEMVPRRLPYALDNGAFGDWRSGNPFDERKFREAVAHTQYLDYYLGDAPDFIVCPDIVAGGLASLAFSLRFVPWLQDRGAPLYLVLQDGMTECDVEPSLPLFQGVFVGGTLPWKISTGERWVRFAHRHGLPCHIGRVGTARRVSWAMRIGADSIDSCLPLWCERYLQDFVAAVDSRQPDLFGGVQ